MNRETASTNAAVNPAVANSAVALDYVRATAHASNTVQFIVFAIGEDHYGVDIMAVHEIKGWVDITHLPKQPEYVRGVLSLRGAVVPIMDLRCRFGEGLTATTPLHIMIIVQIDGRQVGLIGDRVLDIVSVDRAQIQKVPRASDDVASDFLAGLVTHDDSMIALIDLPSLLSADAADAADYSAVDTLPA